MPTGPDPAPSTDPRIIALEDRIARLEQVVDEQQRELQIQFERISQLQADIDIIRGAWTKLKPAPEPGKKH